MPRMTLQKAEPARETAPYGTWRSPITAATLTAASTPLSEPCIAYGATYWLEGRPREAGRATLMMRDADGAVRERTSAPFSVRTRAHSYGGGAYLVLPGGAVLLSSYADGRVHRLDAGPDAAPRAITPEGAWRYADGTLDAARGRAIFVREEAFTDGRPPTDALVAIDLEGHGSPRVLATGHDFFAAPRVSPDGARVAWLTWDHPNMPWDASDLWVATLASDGSLGVPVHVAGGAGESIVQPAWSPDGDLYFVTDRRGFWNLHRVRAAEVASGAMEAASVVTMDADFGSAPWVFGQSMYAFASPSRIVCAYQEAGVGHLATVDTQSGALTRIELRYDAIYGGVHAAEGSAVFLGANKRTPRSLVAVDLDAPSGGPRTEVLARSSATAIDDSLLSIAEPIAFPTGDGATAYGYFYRPVNAGYVAPAGERPPLLVLSHGGPTSRVDPELNPAIQYWTTRGFGVLDVNYGGSTGHGRAYRARLDGRWGEVDVDDCIAGARFLVARGDADGARLVVRGGSAGGYTTLAALAFRSVFHAGASYYGIGDLELLDRDAVATNKFESHYNRSLIGPYPERRDLYVARSPIHSASAIASPVIFFQGADDEVVPPNQSRLMFDALRERGLMTAYLEFEGEGHGFRKAATIERAIEAELTFYARVFGLTLPTPAADIEIANAPAR
jgi:dipeptidyl aminopeptidase/acylaminoacyl peptidase